MERAEKRLEDIEKAQSNPTITTPTLVMDKFEIELNELKLQIGSTTNETIDTDTTKLQDQFTALSKMMQAQGTRISSMENSKDSVEKSITVGTEVCHSKCS